LFTFSKFKNLTKRDGSDELSRFFLEGQVMKAKRVACSLIFSFLFLFSGSSVVFGDDLQDLENVIKGFGSFFGGSSKKNNVKQKMIENHHSKGGTKI
jgi:hypothetical protein